ncbi:hypothetical protein OA848_02495 [Rickettsiales bacterium]|nr:hypothetical protein [Rickettsiales bacterium]
MEDNKEEFNNELDPEIIKIRDQIISKIGDKPLDEINLIIKKLLREQMDEVTRLGALAARVMIIRAKIKELYETKNITKKKPIKINKNIEISKKEEKPEEWMRIKMLESSEVNGKQVDSGVILDAKLEEAKNLITQKKAEEIKENTEEKKQIKAEEKKIEEEKKKPEEKEAIKTEEKKIEEVKEKTEKKEEVKTEEKQTKEVKEESEEKKETKIQEKKEIKNEEKNIELEKEDTKKEIKVESSKDEEKINVDEKKKEPNENKNEVTTPKSENTEVKLKEKNEKKMDLSEDLLKVHAEKVQKQ